MWCGPLATKKCQIFTLIYHWNFPKGRCMTFQGRCKNSQGWCKNSQGRCKTISVEARTSPQNPVRKHTNYHTLECIHRKIKKVKFEPRTTISELFLINKWPGNKLNFEIIKRGCVAGMQNMLSKPWAATVLGLVSVNDGPFGIAIQLFQLRLSTSKAEKSNTSAKGCWESLWKFINLLAIPNSLSRSYSTFPPCSWTTLIEIAVYSDTEQFCHSLLTLLNLHSCSNKITHFIPQAILPFDVLFQTYPEAL